MQQYAAFETKDAILAFQCFAS